MWCNKNFNSHARVGRDGSSFLHHLKLSHFNSHARVGRDAIAWALGGDKYISTHTPAWGVTPNILSLSCLLSFQLTRPRGA